jgi:hypothetical protein
VNSLRRFTGPPLVGVGQRGPSARIIGPVDVNRRRDASLCTGELVSHYIANNMYGLLRPSTS